LIDQDTDKKNAIIRQVAFYLNSFDGKLPMEILQDYKWLEDGFEDLRQDTFKVLEGDDLAAKEKRFKYLDEESNLLKKDFDKLKLLAREIAKNYRLPKYASAFKRMEREEKAANLFEKFIVLLEEARSDENLNTPQPDISDRHRTQKELAYIITSKTKEIITLAPAYHGQVRAFVSDFEKSLDRETAEVNILRFEKAKRNLHYAYYQEFIDFLDFTGEENENLAFNEKNSGDVSPAIETLNSVLNKIEKFGETLEEFKEEDFISEIKKGGHAWFQIVRLKLSRIKVFYTNHHSKINTDSRRKIISLAEESLKLFERSVGKFAGGKSDIDAALSKDSEFLKELLDELRKCRENEDAKNRQNNQSQHTAASTGANNHEKKSVFSRIWRWFGK
jgi:hypothetical protein